jgi:hypothetical protein
MQNGQIGESHARYGLRRVTLNDKGALFAYFLGRWSKEHNSEAFIVEQLQQLLAACGPDMNYPRVSDHSVRSRLQHHVSCSRVWYQQILLCFFGDAE